MILWTVQDIAVWEQLEKTGLYTVPAELIVFPKRDDDACNHMNYAYRWLANQMSKLVGPPPEGVECPIWAWYKRQGRHDGKPDMRQYHHAKGGQCVRMKLDVPDWEVLLSDFDDWHHALNYWYLSQDEADNSEFNEWIASLGVGFRDIGNWNLRSSELSQVRAKVESSWERILGVRQGGRLLASPVGEAHDPSNVLDPLPRARCLLSSGLHRGSAKKRAPKDSLKFDGAP